MQAIRAAVTRVEAIQDLHAETMLYATTYALHRLFDKTDSVMNSLVKVVCNNAVVCVSEAEVFHPEALAG